MFLVFLNNKIWKVFDNKFENENLLIEYIEKNTTIQKDDFFIRYNKNVDFNES